MTQTDLIILLTGFEPFPSAPLNPTEELVRMIERKEIQVPEGADLIARVLPVEYEASWRQLMELMTETAADVVLNFGLSAKAQGFTLERLARNEIKASRPDNAGRLEPPRRIDETRSETYGSALPLDLIEQSLTAHGLPVWFSDDAGGYVCNHLFYQCMSAPARPQAAGFIHVPYLSEQRDALEASGDIPQGHAAQTRDELRRGVEVILGVVKGLGHPVA